MWNFINNEAGLIVDYCKKLEIAKLLKKQLLDEGQVEDERYIEIMPGQKE